MRARWLLPLAAWLLAGSTFAHATLVLGTITTEPNPPLPGAEFSFSIAMTDPTQVPIEDAVVIAEFTAPGSDEPMSVPLTETETAGTYSGRLTLDQAGSYALLLRDKTFRQEEAQASLSIDIGGSEALVPINFVFPPTATSSRNIATWLIWLIGLPVVAAVVVTVLVLTGNRGKGAQENE